MTRLALLALATFAVFPWMPFAGASFCKNARQATLVSENVAGGLLGNVYKQTMMLRNGGPGQLLISWGSENLPACNDQRRFNNRVLASEDAGITWSERQSIPWSRRIVQGVAASPSGQITVAGGAVMAYWGGKYCYANSQVADVWTTSDLGRTWARRANLTTNMGFLSAAAGADNCVVAGQGNSINPNTYSNQIIKLCPNSTSWAATTWPSTLSKRAGGNVWLTPGGSVLTAAGLDAGYRDRNDLYISMDGGSTFRTVIADGSRPGWWLRNSFVHAASEREWLLMVELPVNGTTSSFNYYDYDNAHKSSIGMWCTEDAGATWVDTGFRQRGWAPLHERVTVDRSNGSLYLLMQPRLYRIPINGATAQPAPTPSPQPTPAPAPTLLPTVTVEAEPFVLTDAASWAPIALTKSGAQLCYISAADSSVACPAFKCNLALGTKPQSLLSPFVNVHGAPLDGCTIMAQRADGTVSGVGHDGERRIADISRTVSYTLGSVSPGGSCTMAIVKSTGKMVSTYNAPMSSLCTAQPGTWAWVANQYTSACAGDTTGRVKCWGKVSGGQPPAGTVFITDTNTDTYCGLFGDGTPFCRGEASIAFPEGTVLRYITVDNAGGACGIRADYTLQCFGTAASIAYPSDVPFAYITVSGTVSGKGPQVYCGVRLMDARVACFSNGGASDDVSRHRSNTAGVAIKLPQRMLAAAANYRQVAATTAQGVSPYSATLACPLGMAVSGITFASYGTPRAAADGGPPFVVDPSCHAPTSRANVSELCMGRRSCDAPSSAAFFGGEPCPALPSTVRRWLFISANCSGAGVRAATVSGVVAAPSKLQTVTALTYTWSDFPGVALMGADTSASCNEAPLDLALRMPSLLACKQECLREPRCGAVTYRDSDGFCALKCSADWKPAPASVISSVSAAVSSVVEPRVDEGAHADLRQFAADLKRAQAAATPSAAPGTGAKAKYTFVGREQIFTVPSTVRWVRVSLWGAGGGTMQAPAYGGSGAFVSGDLAVTPGETLRIIVGAGGIGRGSGNSQEEWGAGGNGYSTLVTSDGKPVGYYVGSGGGGRSALQRWDANGGANGTGGWTDVVSAGGGGGGCYSYSEWQPVGGAASWNGTGFRGFDGVQTRTGGLGLAGGGGGSLEAAGLVINAYASMFEAAAVVGDGRRGAGGDAYTCTTCYHYGTGGGGGYYGGGAGGCSGAGGGSSYISQLANAKGDEAQPPRMWRAVGTDSEDWDAEAMPGTSGRPGMVVIGWAVVPSPTPTNTATASETASVSRSFSATATGSVTTSDTATATASATSTRTQTRTASSTASISLSATATSTRSAASTPSSTATGTASPSASITATRTPSATPEPAKYRCRAGTTVNYIDKAGALLISTPEAPGAVNLDCTWIVTAPVGYTVSVAYLAFNAVPNLDFLSIFDGNTASAPLLVYQATGGQLPPKVSSTGRSITVRFLSVDYRNSRGVILSPVFMPVQPIVRPLAAPGSYRCGPGTSVGVVQSSGAVIATDSLLPTDLTGPRPGPEYASDQPRGAVVDCSVTIIAPPGELAVLTYLNYSLSPQRDFWSVHDGSSAAAQPIVFLTTGGSAPPPVVVGSGSALHVRFQSVDYVPGQDRGVVAVVSFITPPRVPISQQAAAAASVSPSVTIVPTPLPTPEANTMTIRIVLNITATALFDPSVCLGSSACTTALQRAIVQLLVSQLGALVESLAYVVRILAAGLQANGAPPSLNATAIAASPTPGLAVRRELQALPTPILPAARRLFSVEEISAGLLSAAARSTERAPSPLWVVVEISRDTAAAAAASDGTANTLRRVLQAASSTAVPTPDPAAILSGLSSSASNGDLTAAWAAAIASLLADDPMGEGSDLYVNAVADQLAKGAVRAGVASSSVTTDGSLSPSPGQTGAASTPSSGLSGGAIAAIVICMMLAAGLVAGFLVYRSRSRGFNGSSGAGLRTKTIAPIRTSSAHAAAAQSITGLRLATIRQASPVFVMLGKDGAMPVPPDGEDRQRRPSPVYGMRPGAVEDDGNLSSGAIGTDNSAPATRSTVAGKGRAASRLTSYRAPGVSPRAGAYRPDGSASGLGAGSAGGSVAQSTRMGIRPTQVQGSGKRASVAYE